MDSEGTFDARGTERGPAPVSGPPPHPPSVPRPGGPPSFPPTPGIPAVPSHAPGRRQAVTEWLRTPRPEADPGVWRLGHRARPDEEPDEVPARRLFAGALIALLTGWLLWSLLWNGYLGRYWIWPLLVLTPDSWRADPPLWATASYTYYTLVGGGLLVFFARLGHVPEIWRRYTRRADKPRTTSPPVGPDPTQWPELRTAGLIDAAETLTEAGRAGVLGDVDYARIRRAWQGVQARPELLPAFTDTVRRQGAASCAHPSGLRDLPVRTATHDLVTAQVRIGTAADDRRNPYARRTTGVALDPSLLGTSLLAVGPSGCGKSVRLIRPVVESLGLLALANRAAVVAVTAQGAQLAPDDAFDLVIAVGRSDSRHDLDLYGGSSDPDEAARMLAEALVGDLAATLPGTDGRRAATALAQLIGPYQLVHGHFPAVPELRELLSGAPAALDALRQALQAQGGTAAAAQLRELDARERQSARGGDDIGVLLAERIAFLDRPAFAASFRTDGGGRQFSLQAIEHPLRVRVDLPERGHAEASRIIARLLLAQFTEAALSRSDRSLFAALVLDDATYTVTADSVRAIQRLRSANAGVVLTLRTLEDVPDPLRGPLLGAVGCRMAFAGLAPWDGGRFAETWGTEWVQTRDVTNRQIISDEPLTKAMHAMRRLVTGKATTAEAITVREVERARWSASDLAHAVPAGHAVLSLANVNGEHTPPLLVDLRT
ncbi:ATP-binding protein [Streptomyces sp. NBC_00690]|uniref:ATP-binding protein n=1 Tax=Streptomyces sp. NBC_00690 TaxID=2975808 RepID=UPI002E283A4F|nr:ATP-binding protein [Streptomyces sp. NBC_00690]